MCHVDGLEDLIKRSLFPKLIFIFNKITAQILQATFVEIDNLLLKFKWKCKGPPKLYNYEKEQSWRTYSRISRL